MLTRIEAVTPKGSLLDLPLDDTDTGLLITNIDGLGPVKATVTSAGFAQIDGSQFQSSRRENRNIVLTIALEADWSDFTVRDLREMVYRHFMTKRWVKLKLYSTDKNTVEVDGVVESAEPDLFTAEPTINVSIVNFDPDFIDPVPVIVPGTTTSTMATTTIDYDGTVETGFNLELFVDRALSDFSIYVNDTQMDFTGSLLANDVLRISTVRGQKYVRLTRDGVESSYLYGVTPQSKWVELEEGPNEFRVYATGLPIAYNMSYINRYGGL